MDHWTDELLDLMVSKLVERKKRESDAAHGIQTVSPQALAIASGGKISYHKET